MEPVLFPPVAAERAARSPTCRAAHAKSMIGVLFGVAARSSPEMPLLSTASETLPPGLPRSSSHSLGGPSARSGRTARESFDAPEDLPKQEARQVALRQREARVLRMPTRRAGGSSGTNSGWRAAEPAARASLCWFGNVSAFRQLHPHAVALLLLHLLTAGICFVAFEESDPRIALNITDV